MQNSTEFSWYQTAAPNVTRSILFRYQILFLDHPACQLVVVLRSGLTTIVIKTVIIIISCACALEKRCRTCFLKLIGKLVVDFLLVITELYSLGLTLETLSERPDKFHYLCQRTIFFQFIHQLG